MAVALRRNSDDRLLTIHTLAQLFYDDCEFRLCRDSLHTSDNAFLALTPAEWATLDRSFDRSVIEARFLVLDPDFDVFLDTAFPPSEAPPGTLAPSEIDWDGGTTYQPAKLDYVIVWDGPNRLRLHELERIIRQYLEPGEVGFSTREQEKRWLAERAGQNGFAADRDDANSHHEPYADGFLRHRVERHCGRMANRRARRLRTRRRVSDSALVGVLEGKLSAPRRRRYDASRLTRRTTNNGNASWQHHPEFPNAILHAR